jgi:hypothetical protein
MKLPTTTTSLLCLQCLLIACSLDVGSSQVRIQYSGVGGVRGRYLWMRNYVVLPGWLVAVVVVARPEGPLSFLTPGYQSMIPSNVLYSVRIDVTGDDDDDEGIH